MTTTLESSIPGTVPPGDPPADRVPVDWRRLRRPLTYVAFGFSLLAAVGT